MRPSGRIWASTTETAAILLRNDLFCVKTICKQYIDDIVGPIRGH
jgi:hypothetical protein